MNATQPKPAAQSRAVGKHAVVRSTRDLCRQPAEVLANALVEKDDVILVQESSEQVDLQLLLGVPLALAWAPTRMVAALIPIARYEQLLQFEARTRELAALLGDAA